MAIWIIFIGISLASYIVQVRLQSKFAKYSKLPVDLTGKEVAMKMLYDSGITDVKVVSTPGQLTDHYNPTTKTVNLSADVYNRASVAAAAVAAHECGHAIQHARAYAPLRMRSALVPAVSFASKWVQWVLLAGILMVQSFPALLMVGVALFAMTTLFSFVTLPVEIDASRRALVWLSDAGITNVRTHEPAKDALKTAAYTYVIAAVSSLATLVYYLMILTSRRN